MSWAQQPIPQTPPLTIDDYALAALNMAIRASGSLWSDFSTAGNDGTAFGSPTAARVGVILDGIDDRIDFGALGTITQVSMWVNLGSATEQLFQIDANKYVHVVAGAVTYVGLTEASTYVNGVATTAIVAGQWEYLVCQFAADSAANFELGWDGAVYGAASVQDLRCLNGNWDAARVLYEYRRCVPDDALRFYTVGGNTDLSRYCRPITPINGAVTGHQLGLDNVNQCLSVPDSADFDLGVGAAATLLMWVYPTSFAGSSGLITKYDGTLNNDTGWLWALEADDMRFTYNDGNALALMHVGQKLVLNQWQLIACVIDRPNGETWLYRNDDPPDWAGCTQRPGSWAKAGPVAIGALLVDGTGPSGGAMRSIRVLRRAISVDEYMTLYDREKRAY